MSNFLPGMKTYIGAGLAMFGTLAQMMGWDWWASISGDVGTIANQVVALVGGVVAVYGRMVAKPKT